ncbi:uncharacterized protein LOC102803222, partial [Saccoglossus kowalevskii]|uniref:Uncharacterized protein LOC102803222 n=1 Tax=Saccoglossus kowalevskii TaxID=10224 RepID=A0ABM0M378_SACKO
NLIPGSSVFNLSGEVTNFIIRSGNKGSFSNDATSNDDVIIEYSRVEHVIRTVFIHFTSDKVDKGMECSFMNIPDIIPNFHLATVHAFYDIDVLGCPEGKFGGNCQYECYCQNGATCHIFNGACKCTTGWKGIACDIDVGAPEFVFCPHNITALLDEGSSSTEVTWPKVEVNDNSGLLNLTSNHQARDEFIIGIHNILYTAVDIHGNTAICRFSVNVKAVNIETTKTVIVSSIVISLLLVVLVTFGFVVCLRYRKNRLMYPLLFGRSKDDDNKEWDAFVAVKGGTEDETFVYKELLHELEENNDYKINIHHRDFTPGIPIVDNILYAIKNSRRTILILSPEFVRSELCNYEVDQAKFELFGLRH